MMAGISVSRSLTQRHLEIRAETFGFSKISSNSLPQFREQEDEHENQPLTHS